jgi:hypothetical protein
VTDSKIQEFVTHLWANGEKEVGPLSELPFDRD